MRHSLPGAIAGVVTCFVLTAASCSSAAGKPGDTGIATDTVGGRAAIARLESEARAMAKPGGCAVASQCRMAPVGARPCGGPRDYLAWCPATTDSVALYRKLDELRAAEQRYNQAAGIFGTCEMRMPPTATISGGTCSLPAP